ncbi:hypothetical protein [Pontibacter sp. HJ8]
MFDFCHPVVEEYINYICHRPEQQFLADEVEDLEPEEQHGISGIKAIRV